MTITEFLEARIAEDEAAAERGGYHNGGSAFANDNYGCLLIQPARVLAECAAKRAVLEEHRSRIYTDEEPGFSMVLWDCLCSSPAGKPCPTVGALAAVYSDHPDYDKDWTL